MVFLTNVDRILLTKKENSNKKNSHIHTHTFVKIKLLDDLQLSISNLGCEEQEEIDMSTLYIYSLQLQVCTK